ncbi:ribonuclease D [Novosphingobium aromaticivorans DSM 12444]|uniref:Ribonuclease D n=1 Tax=Novosphingobium aromaticivorans (strain ATCC 700278 / DSM 12444 / CCUG 56034 / CIP 105152 / NBRC 16084 / F199) TaxID=279238 RepID=Q2G8P2_NOVAD|nr:ribonuclease D [Novosphingobium aromaticivorans]ABD25781.1 ribonuclease D [Novosphingobium aromaticivorans DSM 12444]SCY03572.1 ribonuclease D [Novosphingobium aromaticivorans]
MKIHPLITTTEALADLCERLAKADFVTVDTEFMRENTYWPELCLVQIADDKEAAAIDPLAPGLDMSPLLDLLVDNEDVLKVFHAGGQDVEIIYNLTGKTPHPIFDTQIAMMAVSQSEQIGYSNLVESWLGLSIDKGARFTDWSRRPLTERQIEYAIGDVTHLSKIFPKLLKRLIKTGRGEWLDIEMEKLADPENYRTDMDTVWQKIRAPSRNPAVLGRLKSLAAWREREAMDKNIPKGRIMRDETLADIASHPPREQHDLAKVRGLSAGWKDNDIGRRLMQTLADSKPLTDAEMPPKAPRGAPLGKEGALVADLLKLLLKIRSREIDIAARLLARTDDLELLAAGQRRNLPILEGWRFEQFGRDALELVEGKLAFAVVNGKLKMAHIDDIGGSSEEPEVVVHVDE